MIKNYDVFSKKFLFGDTCVLLEGEKIILDFLLNDVIDFEKLNLLKKKVEINTPTPHNFDSILASSALDACTCIFESLNFIILKDTKILKTAIEISLDTIDMYIVDKNNLNENDSEIESEIFSHHLMKREINIQIGIINYLQKIDHIKIDDIYLLIDLQESNKFGSLHLN